MSNTPITDEMIARARIAYWDDHSDPQVAMRSALEAALQSAADTPAPPPPQSHSMRGLAAAIVAEYDAFLAARQTYAPSARLVASDAIGSKALDLLRMIADLPLQINVVDQLRCHERPKSEYQCDRNEADHHKDAPEATATFTRKEHDVHSANNGEDEQKRHNTPGAYEPNLGAAATTSPSTETAAPDTATVAHHMKDFEAFVAQIAPKLHWKVWQDLGSDRSLYSGGFDGWQHGFGMTSFEPRPLAVLIPEMKEALALAATATEDGR